MSGVMCKFLINFYIIVICVSYFSDGVPSWKKYRNVTIQSYYIQITKSGLAEFDVGKTIQSSNNLMDGLPIGLSFVTVSIIDQYLPLLFTNSLRSLTADRLIINRCNIMDMEINVFNDVVLGRLDLSENELYAISNFYFSNISVDSLYLSNNRIKYIDSGSFRNIARTDQKDFKYSTSNHARKLRGLKNFTEIRLDGNKLRTIEAGVFNNLTIRILNLKNNSIKILKKDAFTQCDLLISLTLEDNRIRTITKNIFQSKELKYLSFRNNRIRHIEPGSFEEIRAVQTIDLSKNKLQEIKKGIFSNLSVEKLDLSENEISKIEPGAFENLPYLKILDLRGNKLKVVDNDFYKQLFVHI